MNYVFIKQMDSIIYQQSLKKSHNNKFYLFTWLKILGF